MSDHSTSLSRDLENSLRTAVTGEVRFDEMTRGLYSTDASIYQIAPIGVVLPRNRDDVQATLEIATRYQVPVLPRGSGTSLSGQTVAAAVVIDLSKYMNRVLDIDVERGLVTIEPGVVLDQLNTVLKPHGLQFGPDVATSSRANLGGMIGNNSAGSRSVRQGKVIDHVRTLDVLLADGTPIACRPTSSKQLRYEQQLAGTVGDIYRRFPEIINDNRAEIIQKFPRVLRRVSGYNLDAFLPELYDQMPLAPVPQELDRLWTDRKEFNLARIIVGAEGTLGTVVQAQLHAVSLPKERGVVLLEFGTIDAALEATPRILECEPSAVELLDRNIVELSRNNLKYRNSLAFVSGTPEALLIVEFSGETETAVKRQLQHLQANLTGCLGLDRFLQAETAAQREQIWNCRKAGAPLLLSIPGARKPIAFVEDTAVAPQQLAEFTRRFRAILSRHGITGAYYGHASVGCLHIRPMIDTKSAGDLAILKQVSDEVADLVHEYGGAMTGEHGDGLARSYHNVRLFGPRLFEAFRQVKRLFDPTQRMNPGKVTESPSPIESLRYGIDYPGASISTFQDFSREAEIADASGQGFLAAAEACNGSGVCRKTGTGTMCPSYMVTRDEEHTTRGRANALRLALTGQLPDDSLTSSRMWDVMDLCLMCKGCKSECPSNVDVAKLKVEFLAHYYTQHPPRFGTRLLANTGWVNRIGSLFAPVSNALAGLAPRLRQWLTGIDHRRAVPSFSSESFSHWFGRHQPSSLAGSRGRVVLLDDCLTGYCESSIPQSAVELLEHAGYAVERAGLWCCGRPLISKGLLDQAKALVQRNVARLDEFVRQGYPILGVEPSCLLTLVDEYPDLFPSVATSRVKNQAFLLDAWLADRVGNQETTLAFRPTTDSALLHGHCQQKALVGTAGTRRALGLIPGLNIREVDSGCCGMAGSFGYEHYDISMQIGERVLFPAVRSHVGENRDRNIHHAANSSPIIAPGFSCRHQIHDGTGTTAQHPIQLLRQHLVIDCAEVET